MATQFPGNQLDDLKTEAPYTWTDPPSTGAPAIRQIKRYLVESAAEDLNTKVEALKSKISTPVGCVLKVAEDAPSTRPNHLLMNGDTIGAAGSNADHADDAYEELFNKIRTRYGNNGTKFWDVDADSIVALPNAPLKSISKAGPPDTGSVTGVSQQISYSVDIPVQTLLFTIAVDLASLSETPSINPIDTVRWKIEFNGGFAAVSSVALSYSATNGDPMTGKSEVYNTTQGSQPVVDYFSSKIPFNVSTFTAEFTVGLNLLDKVADPGFVKISLDQVSSDSDLLSQYIRSK